MATLAGGNDAESSQYRLGAAEKALFFFPIIQVWTSGTSVFFDLFRVALLLAGCFLLIQLVQTRRVFVAPKAIWVWYGILFSSALWSISFFGSAFRLLQVTPFFVYGLFVFQVFRTDTRARLAYHFLIGCGVMAVCDAVWLLMSYGTLRGEDLKAVSNEIGSAAELALLPVVAMLVMNKGARRLFVAVLLSFMVFTVLASASRGALLSSILGLVLFGRHMRIASSRSAVAALPKAVLLVGVTVVIFYLLLFAIPEAYLSKIFMRMELLSFDEQVRQGYLEKHDERIVALIDAYKVITEHPILGIGFGSFAMASTNKVFLPHNWLISSWVSAGVAGAAAIVYLCISSIRSAGKVIRNPQNGDLWIRRALFVSLVMVWFHGLFRPVEFNAGFYVLIAWAFSEGRRRVLGI